MPRRAVKSNLMPRCHRATFLGEKTFHSREIRSPLYLATYNGCMGTARARGKLGREELRSAHMTREFTTFVLFFILHKFQARPAAPLSPYPHSLPPLLLLFLLFHAVVFLLAIDDLFSPAQYTQHDTVSHSNLSPLSLLIPLSWCNRPACICCRRVSLSPSAPCSPRRIGCTASSHALGACLRTKCCRTFS